MPISAFQYREMLARTSLKEATPSVGSPVAREKDLHKQILSYCQSRGFICFHSRMDRRPTNQMGTPDIICALDNGRTIYVECKRKGAKCTPAQNAMLAWLAKNNQVAVVVTSLEEFIACIP